MKERSLLSRATGWVRWLKVMHSPLPSFHPPIPMLARVSARALRMASSPFSRWLSSSAWRKIYLFVHSVDVLTIQGIHKNTCLYSVGVLTIRGIHKIPACTRCVVVLTIQGIHKYACLYTMCSCPYYSRNPQKYLPVHNVVGTRLAM